MSLDNIMLPTSSRDSQEKHVTIIYEAEITFQAHMTFISDNREREFFFYDRLPPMCICLFAISMVQ